MGAWGLGREAAVLERERVREERDLEAALEMDATQEEHERGVPEEHRVAEAHRKVQGQKPTPDEAQSTMTDLAGKVLSWIPGEVVVLYGALITLFVGTSADSPGDAASIILTVLGVIFASGFVVLAAWSSTSDSEWLTKRIKGRAFLAGVAFVIWSLTVPDSGWQEIKWIAEHPAQTAGIAGVFGLIFSLIATGADNRWAKDTA
jgi:hypothetical protein